MRAQLRQPKQESKAAHTNGHYLKPLYPKLKVNRPGDIYEQEADRVADQVMRMPEPAVQRASETDEEEELFQPKLMADENVSQVQRQAEPEEEDELVQTKPLADQITPLVQRQVEPEEDEEILQTKNTRENTPCARHDLQAQVRSLRGVGQPLPKTVRNFFEPRFGRDFSQVRIHTGAEADLLSRQLGAKAFTTARDVFFREGAYQPDTDVGKGLLAHELAHVVHQAGTGDLIQRQGGNPPANQWERYREVLHRSNTNDEAWEAGLQSRHFLGVRIERGVHKELSDRLGMAEKDLREKGLTAKLLNIKSITGYREPKKENIRERASFHNFGLAIDIDSEKNPFVARSETTREIINRAYRLKFKRKIDIMKLPRWPISDLYRELKKCSDALEWYFEYRGKYKRPGISHVEAVISILATRDYERMKVEYPRPNMDPAKGFMQLDRRLVMALVKKGQLEWGGQWQSGKDIMHFDWRKGTIKLGTIRNVNP